MGVYSVAQSRSSFVLPAFLALSVITSSVFAFQPLVTDDTGTQGMSGNQIEFSLNHDRQRAGHDSERTDSVPVVYTRGLAESLDVFAGVSHARIRVNAPGDDTRGFGNPSLGAKWRFYENEDTGTSVALKPELILPVSRDREERGLGSGKTSGNLTFILTQEVPFGAIHFNAGVGRERFRDNDANPDVAYRRASVAPVWDVSGQWKLALDMGLEQARDNTHTVRSKFVEIGAIYSPDKNVDLALGIVRQSDDDRPKSTTHSATVGLTWRF